MPLNWDDLRFFLVLQRRGTLSAAARELKVSQPTVGRRIAALERRIGAKLFLREASGFSLSPAGSEVLGLAERMELDALAVERRLAGRDDGVRGLVRVTASEWLVSHVIAKLVGPLLALNPELTLELVAEARHVNLIRREADVALRPRRFEQDTIVQRATAKLGFGLYASPAYLADRGRPRVGDGRDHIVIAMSDDTGDVAREWLQKCLPGARRAIQTNGRDAMLTLAEAGVGIACLARVVGDAAPTLQRLSTVPSAPSPTLWLGTHRDARHAERVRTVASYLGDRLRALERELCPA